MYVFSLLITLSAGLATVIGAFLAYGNKNKKVEGISLAFATGIMLMISLGELIPESEETIGLPLTLSLLAAGAIISLILDLVLPHHHHEHENDLNKKPGHFIDECECAHHEKVSKSMIIALLLHNILEGLATGVTAFSNSRMGLSMAIGIALHNIPIGATLGISLHSAGNSKARSITKTALVGLSQPLGALVGLLFIGITGTPQVLSVCMAIVSGILVFIAFDELWPAARNAGSRNMNIVALIAGICFIPITEMLI